MRNNVRKRTISHESLTKTQITCVSAQTDQSCGVRKKKLFIIEYQNCTEYRLWSDCANALVNLKLRWANMSKGTFLDFAAPHWYIVDIVIIASFFTVLSDSFPWLCLHLCGVLHCHLNKLTTYPTQLHVRPAKKQIRLRICTFWSVSSLGTYSILKKMLCPGSFRVFIRCFGLLCPVRVAVPVYLLWAATFENVPKCAYLRFKSACACA